MASDWTQDRHYDRFRILLNALQGESGRGSVLVFAAVIEEMLGEVLAAFLIEDKATQGLLVGGYAPLGTFKAKIDVSRAMGLISASEYKDIELVRKIRNRFAHSVIVSFADKSVADMVNALSIGMKVVDRKEAEGPHRDPGSRFQMVAAMIVHTLYNRAHYAKAIRLTEREWPE